MNRRYDGFDYTVCVAKNVFATKIIWQSAVKFISLSKHRKMNARTREISANHESPRSMTKVLNILAWPLAAFKSIKLITICQFSRFVRHRQEYRIWSTCSLWINCLLSILLNRKSDCNFTVRISKGQFTISFTIGALARSRMTMKLNCISGSFKFICNNVLWWAHSVPYSTQHSTQYYLEKRNYSHSFVVRSFTSIMRISVFDQLFAGDICTCTCTKHTFVTLESLCCCY